MNRNTRMTVLMALCSFAMAPHAGAQEKGETITFVAAGPLPTATQELLAQIARTTDAAVSSGSDPFTVLREHCGGSFTNDYYKLVQEANPGFLFSADSAERLLHMPACAKVSSTANNATALVLKGDTLATLLQRHLGVKPGTKVSPCQGTALQAAGRTCNVDVETKVASLNGGTLAGLDRPLRVGRTLTLPWSARPTTIVLKDGVDAKNAIVRLAGLGQPSAATPQVLVFTDMAPSAGLKLVRPLTADDPILAATPCAASTTPPANWPFNQARVIEILEHGRAQIAKKHIVPLVSVIRVADTGVSGLTTFFPQVALSVNPYEKPNVPRDNDKNGYFGDYYGFESDASGSVEPFDNDSYKQHGTQVADIALGGFALRKAYPQIYDLLKLNVAKIFWRPGTTVLVNDSAFVSAIRAIQNHAMPSVVNFSVGAGSENNMPMFLQSLKDAQQLNFLAVIAAGNNHKDIANQELTYPATYGGGGNVASRYLMTVGASDPSGMPAKFTNFSSDRVDILAPGCRIPYIGEDGNTQSLQGTSVAAPLVSFTAGLIHGLGVGSMADVKSRIIASADYRASHATFTRYGGIVLNVERALAVHQDSIRFRTESEDRRGVWVRSDDDLSLCEHPVLLDPRDVMSISSYNQGGDVWLRYLVLAKDGALNDPRYCKAGQGGLTFQYLDGSTRQLTWAELDVLTPAYHFPSTSN
jgi:hypothetical protein